MTITLSRRLRTRGFDALGPGVDPAMIWLLRRYHFPASRLWAAANVGPGDGDMTAFAAGLPARQRRRAEGAVGRKAYAAVRDAKARADDRTAAWREIAIDGGDGDPAAAESERRRAASLHLATMMPLATAVGRQGLPLVDWRMSPKNHAPAPPDAAAFCAPADLKGVAAGPVFKEGDLARQWLTASGETGRAGDRAYARVTWPTDREVRGAVVAGSGVGVEWDLYVRARPGYDFSSAFAAHGLAVLELVSPGHGLRALEGQYGGEAFFAGAPVSSADLLIAQCREAARFIAWAKDRWKRPTGVFGLSMSSFAAQLILSHAGAWPEQARPDGGFLLAHAGDLKGVVQGKLSRALGVETALAEAGWTEADLEPWRDALAPAEQPATAPERIVSVIGYLDRVTPFRDGAALARTWGIPKRNRVRLPHGHMALPKRLLLDDGPIARFADVLVDDYASSNRTQSASGARSVRSAFAGSPSSS